MKKIMVALAAVALTAAVNASTVAWGITNGSLDSTKFASGTLYLFVGQNITDISTWAGSQTSFSFDSVKAALGADLANLHDAPNSVALTSGAGKSTGNAVTSYGGVLVEEEWTDTKTGNLYVYCVGISADGKNLAVATGTKKLSIGAAATPANATYSGTGFNTYAANVPEPTSGLLLLLGIAGMALRRRRA